MGRVWLMFWQFYISWLRWAGRLSFFSGSLNFFSFLFTIIIQSFTNVKYCRNTDHSKWKFLIIHFPYPLDNHSLQFDAYSANIFYTYANKIYGCYLFLQKRISIMDTILFDRLHCFTHQYTRSSFHICIPVGFPHSKWFHCMEKPYLFNQFLSDAKLGCLNFCVFSFCFGSNQ